MNMHTHLRKHRARLARQPSRTFKKKIIHTDVNKAEDLHFAIKVLERTRW